MEFQVAVLPRCAGIPDFFLPVNFLAPRNAWPAPPASNLSYGCRASGGRSSRHNGPAQFSMRSEEHTSELQSRLHLVCRLLLEKKKKTKFHHHINKQGH